MSKPTRATQAKRQRERSKNEKQQEKRFERATRKEQRKLEGTDGLPDTRSEEDPDIAGIVPGPQPESLQ